MKVSKQTVDILKSFSAINNGMMIHAGSRIRTQDTMNKMIAYADIQDNFPQDFAIYDLGEFLNALDLVTDADLTFNKDSVTIKNERTSLQYTYGATEYITVAPEKINYPDADANNVNFDLTTEDLGQVLKASSILGLDFIAVSTTKGSQDIVLSAIDPENPSANKYQIVVGKTSADSAYKFVFKAERLKLVRQDYKVSINPAGISRFVGLNLEYYVAIEASSQFEKA